MTTKSEDCALESSGGVNRRWRCATCGYHGVHDTDPGCQKGNSPEANAAKNQEMRKGVFGGRCNRSACLKPNAVWWNRGSHAYYCAACADMLSRDPVNKADALKLWNGPLCVLHIKEGVEA